MLHYPSPTLSIIIFALTLALLDDVIFEWPYQKDFKNYLEALTDPFIAVLFAHTSTKIVLEGTIQLGH